MLSVSSQSIPAIKQIRPGRFRKCVYTYRLSKSWSTAVYANPKRDAQGKPELDWDDPLEALKAAVREERVILSYKGVDEEEEEETWEDLLDMEENVWDPHSGQAGLLDELLERPVERASENSVSQEVSSVSMTTLQQWVGEGADTVCIIDVSPANRESRIQSGASGLPAGVKVVHVPLDSLHADAVEQFRDVSHVLVASSAEPEAVGSLNAKRRRWQACTRLRRVYGLSQAAILEEMDL